MIFQPLPSPKVMQTESWRAVICLNEEYMTKREENLFYSIDSIL